MTDLEEIVDFIAAHNEMFGYSPTVRECGMAVGLRSSSTIYVHLCSLYDQGRILWEPSVSRTLRVPS